MREETLEIIRCKWCKSIGVLWPCYEVVFVCYTSKYRENLCLGLAFLDKLLLSECGNETDLFI